MSLFFSIKACNSSGSTSFQRTANMMVAALAIALTSSTLAAKEGEPWMAKISGETNLNRISIPGTHDSGAWSVPLPGVICQKWNIGEQLRRGIRFLDIRCQMHKNAKTGKNEFRIHHGAINLQQTFHQVMLEVSGFLKQKAYSKETVIMRWTVNEGSGGIRNAAQLKAFCETFLNNPQYSDYFYRPKSKPSVIPKLKDVRGRIVIVSDHSSQIPASVRLNYTTGNVVQDEYEVFLIGGLKNGAVSLATKKKLVTEYLDKAANSNRWVFNYLSGSTGMEPGTVAVATNGAARKHISGNACVGTVIMDFPPQNLVDQIVDANFPSKLLRVFCEAGYVATFSASWKENGASKSWSSGRLSAGKRKTTRIPADATNVVVSATMHSLKDKQIFRVSNPNLDKEFKVYGTIFKSKWKQQ